MSITLHGHSILPGIVIAPAVIFYEKKILVEQYKINFENVDNEIIRFENSLKKSKYQLTELKNNIETELGEEFSKIFSAHLMILNDNFFIEEIVNRIQSEQVNVEYILNDALSVVLDSFKNLDDEYLKQRASDIYDVGRRLLQNLTSSEEFAEFSDLPEKDFILVSKDLMPSTIVSLNTKNIKGLILESGSKNSHTTILAKALRIPTLIDVANITKRIIDKNSVILNSVDGICIVNPKLETIELYNKKLKKYNLFISKQLLYAKNKCKTKDGVGINIFANVEILDELKYLENYGAEGIGLFRTEFLYIDKARFPSENEQFFVYRKLAESLGENKVIIRTLDLGGDKLLPDSDLNREANPFLGLRAIRYCLKNKSVFKIQLKAILKASRFGNIGILIPMITFIQELKEVKYIIKDIKKELIDSGFIINSEIKIGIMVEVPSTAFAINDYLKYVDFVSIGTNDLTQYMLAIDRTNSDLSDLFTPYNPAVLKLVYEVIKKCNKIEMEVNVCGDMASSPIGAILLVGMGLRNLSLPIFMIPEIKNILKNTTIEFCERILKKVIKLKNVKNIEKFLLRKVLPQIKDNIYWDENMDKTLLF